MKNTDTKGRVKNIDNAKASESNSTEMNNWREIIKRFPEANFLQSPEYGRMNELLGDKVIVAGLGDKKANIPHNTKDEETDLQRKSGNSGRALMIVRDAKRGRYLEIPCGPLIDWEDTEMRTEMMRKIREVARAEKCVFVRIRPQLPATEKNLQILADLGFRKAPMHLAAEHTVIIDLAPTEAELLANMRRQTRYEVRRAGKLGITVSRDDSEDIFKEFHKVQTETAKRQGFIPPSLEVLLAERKAFFGNIWIYTAKTTEGEPVAYGLIIKNGREGDYYEAASTDLNRKLPGAYALLWQVMRDLKKDGVERFNLWGIAPKNQPKHRYAGVTTFKTGFGGEMIEYVAAHDLVISKIGYLKNLIVETIRKKRRHL